MTAVSVGVIFAHLLVGVAVWFLLPLIRPGTSTQEEVEVEGDGRYWFAPSDFLRNGNAPVAPPPPAAPAAPKSVAAASAPMVPMALEPTPPSSSSTVPTNKIITLSPVIIEGTQSIPLVKSARPPLTMMDLLKQGKLEEVEKEARGGADMDPVLKALEGSLIREWNAPALPQVPVLQRNAALRITLGRQGEVLEAVMSKPSGSQVLDQSVQDAATRVKKISESLPSSFPKDRYTVEVNFHIE